MEILTSDIPLLWPTHKSPGRSSKVRHHALRSDQLHSLAIPSILEITTNSAFWILDYHRRTGSRLEFGGRILGETAAATAIVIEVLPELQRISVRLFSETEGRNWERVISFRNAKFSYIRSEDKEAPSDFLSEKGWASLLSAEFTDGTLLFFADRQL